MSHSLDRALSSLSLSSQPEDDWDKSLLEPAAADSTEQPTTPRNSVVFPAEGTPSRRSRYSSAHSKGPSLDGTGKKRTLSELLRLHSEKGSKGRFSPEEAARIADVLGQWINASSSPYEGEDDDFFARVHSQDDMSIASKRPIPVQMALRPRGMSESATSPSSTMNSRPPSSAGFVSSS